MPHNAIPVIFSCDYEWITFSCDYKWITFSSDYEGCLSDYNSPDPKPYGSR